MRIGIFHNRYARRGGEDIVVDTEVELLRKAGHEVATFIVENRELVEGGLGAVLRTGLRAPFDPEMTQRVGAFLDREPVEVAHVHNFFPRLTPALHFALRERGVPVVQTLHNYRLFCANGLFLREGRVCEDCLGRGPWNAVRHGCFRGSRLQTVAWARMVSHQRRSAWHTCVDRFLVPSRFAFEKLVEAGLPEARMQVKPNPVLDPGPPTPPGRGALYAGRLSPEKGIALLLDAWRGFSDEPLAVAGVGPEAALLSRRGPELPGLRALGALAPAEVARALSAAAFVVLPSLCYENHPLGALEAMAAGRALVASDAGALPELVEHERTGLVFESGNPAALAEACRRLLSDPALTERLGREARQRWEDLYAPEPITTRLLGIYSELREAGSSAVRR